MYISDVPIHCINYAASEYHVPAKLIIAILNVEQGRIGMASKNKNGTYDLGPMQINTSWWPKLSTYGYTKEEIQNNACINIEIGTWILSKNIADGNNFFIGIGLYHSGRLDLNQKYVQQVRIKYTQLHAKLIN